MSKLVVKSRYYPPNSFDKSTGDSNGRGGYLNYIGLREGVEITQTFDTNASGFSSRHGLFSNYNAKISISDIAKKLNDFKGNVFAIILSLKRKDAERTGFDNKSNWQDLICSNLDMISYVFQIPLCRLNWFAAFHDEGQHPHVHMVLFSDDEKEGFVTKEGLNYLRKAFDKQIFRVTLPVMKAYVPELSQNEIDGIISANENKIQEGYSNTELTFKLQEVKECLDKYKNKKDKAKYGYVSKYTKTKINEALELLESDELINALYDLWYKGEEYKKLKYRNTLPERIRFSKHTAFKSVRNKIIEAAMDKDQDQAIIYNEVIDIVKKAKITELKMIDEHKNDTDGFMLKKTKIQRKTKLQISEEG